ncbi:MAG: hypothetical protein ACI4BG_01775 [Prevotella sp.]
MEKTRLIQEDNVQTFLFDNGEQKNLRILRQEASERRTRTQVHP